MKKNYAVTVDEFTKGYKTIDALKTLEKYESF